ncbi:MAG: hypothetical protein AAB432_01080 [Patescibacteria group bacterium]
MNEYVKTTVYSFPTWEENVWKELQSKNFATAGKNLQSFIEKFTDEEWSFIIWPALIQGIPAIRGDLTELEWQEHMMPILATIVINLGNGHDIEKIYRGLDFDLLKRFHNAILEAIPGEKTKDKLETLKIYRSSIYTYFLASPIQYLGLNLLSLPSSLTLLPLEKIINLYDNLPIILKNSIFSYETADVVFRSAKTNHVADEKIPTIAAVVGKVLIGVLRIDDFPKEIESTLAIDGRSIEPLIRSINEQILGPKYSDVDLIYTPISDLLEKAENFNTEELIKDNTAKNTILLSEIGDKVDADEKKPRMLAEILKTTTFSKTEKNLTPSNQGKSFDTPQDKPLILHEEKSFTENTERPKNRGFLNFFKKGGEREENKDSVKVKIETPEEMTKIVHYSELSTPAETFGKESGIINLETLTPTKNKASAEKIIVAPLVQERSTTQSVPASKPPIVGPLSPIMQPKNGPPRTEKPFWTGKIFDKKDSPKEIIPEQSQIPVKKNSEPEVKLKGNVINLK